MQIAIVVNNTAALTPTWTTIHLIDAFLKAGHRIRLIESTEIDILPSGQLQARAWCLDPPGSGIEVLTRVLQRRSGRREVLALSTCDLLLLRVNPLRGAILTFAMLVEEAGIPVVNSPSGLARTSSKAWLATLAGVPRPATLITRSRSAAQRFVKELGKTVVVKPMVGSGGRGVQRIPRGRTDLLDQAIDHLYYGGHFVVQEYLEEADAGEKRLVWADGEVLGAYLRQRASGEFRHNLRQGSEPLQCEISSSDLSLAAAVGPHLIQNGIRIAGLDVIGRYLVEVNTLNPGGVHYAELLRSTPGPRLADRIVEHLTKNTHREHIHREGTTADAKQDQ
jgi:glutathione synthase